MKASSIISIGAVVIIGAAFFSGCVLQTRELERREAEAAEIKKAEIEAEAEALLPWPAYLPKPQGKKQP